MKVDVEFDIGPVLTVCIIALIIMGVLWVIGKRYQ